MKVLEKWKTSLKAYFVKSCENQLFVEAAYLYIWAIAVQAHPALVCDLRNLRQVVIFKLIQANVMGQPG